MKTQLKTETTLHFNLNDLRSMIKKVHKIDVPAKAHIYYNNDGDLQVFWDDND